MTNFGPSEWPKEVDHEHGFVVWKLLPEFSSASLGALATSVEIYSAKALSNLAY